MVCNLHFIHGLLNLEFQYIKPYQFPGRMEKLLLMSHPRCEPTTSRTPRFHNKQEVPHPTWPSGGGHYFAEGWFDI